MIQRTNFLLLVLALTFTSASYTQNTPLNAATTFTYQGELLDEGAPATASYDFRFRLYDERAGGVELGEVIRSNVPIRGGVFTAPLDFGDVFTGEPRWMEIALRKPSESDYEVLSPRQHITPAPYAMHAEFVGNDSVMSANIVNGSVTQDDLASGAVASVAILDGTVTTLDLANGSVSPAKLADGSVITDKIANAAVTTEKLASAAVTADKIAPGAIGSIHIDTGQIQRRIQSTCPTGLPFLGVDISGEVVCDSVASTIDENSPDGPSGGLWIDMIVRNDDKPLLVYRDGAGNSGFYDCFDTTCQSGVRRGFGGNDAKHFSLAMSGVSPITAYADPTLTVTRCFGSDGSCFSTLRYDGLTTHDVSFVSIADTSSRFPVITYFDQDNTALAMFLCDNSDCSTGSIESLDLGGTVGRHNSVAIGSDGIPVVSYYDSANGDLKLYRCANTACTSGTARVLTTAGDVGKYSDLVLDSNNRARISYYDATNGDLKLYVCGNVDCTATAVGAGGTLDSLDDTGLATSMVLRDDGRPLISYTTSIQADPKVFDCDNPNCTSGTSTALELSAGSSGNFYTSLGLRSDGRPVMAYRKANEDLARMVVCGNAECTQP